jgi:GntR family transcriptional regulator/MocR family aminotransferase
MRRLYRARRDMLMRAIAQHLPDAKPRGIAAGLHVTLYLPDGLDEAEICRRAARRGVAVDGLARYRLSSGGPPALLLGYGSASESSLKAALRILAGLVRRPDSAKA